MKHLRNAIGRRVIGAILALVVLGTASGCTLSTAPTTRPSHEWLVALREFRTCERTAGQCTISRDSDGTLAVYGYPTPSPVVDIGTACTQVRGQAQVCK